MTKEIKAFFQKLEKENQHDYFLLRKLYYDPTTVFSSELKDLNSDKFYNKNAIENYIFNNNFLYFLELAYQDPTFMNKMNYYLFYSIAMFLDKMEELVSLNTENDLSYKEVVGYIKSHIKDYEIYKIETAKNKMKNFDMSTSYRVLIETERILSSYNTYYPGENEEDNKPNNTL